MKKYAVLRIKGSQFKISEGEEILVDRLNGKVESETLLVVDAESVKIGKPLVSDTEVKLKVIKEDEKGEKVRVFKYKAKSRYRKRMGFRPVYTRLLVEKIQ